MSVTAAIVFAVLQRQPRCWADRKVDPAVKTLQLNTIAVAIDTVAPTVERAAYLIDIGYQESRWCIDVGSGQRRGGRGEGYWQLEGSHHAAGARSGLSLEATTSQAALASAALRLSRQCGAGPAAVLTAYAGRPCYQAEEWYLPPTDRPRSCSVGVDCVRQEGWPTLDARVKGYWWAVSALRRAGAT